MSRKFIIFACLAVACQVNGQLWWDNYDSSIPGATFQTSIDPYGFSRPLTQSVESLGVSYRPASTGGVLPALYDPLTASRPGANGLEPVGYTTAGNSPFGGSYGGVYDGYLTRPYGFLSGVGGSSIYPDSSAPVPVYTGRIPGTQIPSPSTIAMSVVPISTTPVSPATYAVNPVPVSVPVSSVVNPVQAPTPLNQFPVTAPVASAFPSASSLFGTSFPASASFPFGSTGLGSNSALGSSTFPGASSFPFGTSNLPSLGALTFPGFFGFPFGPIGGMPNVPIGATNGGNLPLSSSISSGNGISGSSSAVPSGNFLTQA